MVSAFGRFLFFLILVFISSANLFAEDNEKYLMDITIELEKGDSCLFSGNGELARDHYEVAWMKAGMQGNDFYKTLSLYKTGYSLLIEDENFLALAYFTEIQLLLTPETARDSALFFLANLEEQAITMMAILSLDNIDITLAEYTSTLVYLNSNLQKRINFLLGEIYTQRLEFTNARDNYQKAVEIKTKDTYLDEWSWCRLADTYNRLLEYQRAIDCYGYLYNKDVKFIENQIIYYHLADNYLELKMYDKAINYFLKSLEYETTTDFRINTFINIGHCYKRKDLFGNAKNFYDQALQLALQEGIGAEYISVTYSTLGLYYRKTGDPELEHSYLKESYKYAFEFNLSLYYKAQIVDLLATYYYNSGMYNEVIEIADSFLNTLEEGSVSNSQINFRRYYNNILKVKSRALFSLWKENKEDIDYLINSRKTIQVAIESALEGYGNLSSETTKLFFLSRLRENIEIDFLAGFYLNKELNDTIYLNSMLHLIEMSKSSILKANIKRTEAITGSDIPIELQEYEAKLKKHISRLNYYLDDGNKSLTDSGQKKQLRIELAISKTKYDSLLRVFESAYPKYNNLSYTTALYCLQDIQQALDTNQLILNYFSAREQLFVLLIGRNTADVFELGAKQDIVNHIFEFRNLLQEHRFDVNFKEQLQCFSNKSYALYSDLLKPIKEKLGNKRLIIIPDKELNLLPFDVLISDSPGPELASYAELPYLLKTNAITTMYTVEQLIDNPETLNRNSKFVGFALEYNTLSHPDSFKYDNLPGAKKEVNGIREFFKGRIFMAGDASKKTFLKEAGRNDIMHLALHTNISDIDPMYSQLLFANGSGTEIEELFTYELYGARFNSSLIVLSGCNTGFGKIKSGEGIMNLARGFLYGGAGNVVVTQWAVADKSSARLMYYFYKHLTEGTTTDVALQQAKIDFLLYEDPLKHHPYYWSGYISIGNPVEYKRTFNPKWYFLFLIAFVATIYIARKNKRISY